MADPRITELSEKVATLMRLTKEKQQNETNYTTELNRLRELQASGAHVEELNKQEKIIHDAKTLKPYIASNLFKAYKALEMFMQVEDSIADTDEYDNAMETLMRAKDIINESQEM